MVENRGNLWFHIHFDQVNFHSEWRFLYYSDQCHFRHNIVRSNLIIEDQKIKIPSRISIRIWQALKIRKIRESDILMSIILINEIHLAYKLGQYLHTPSQYEMEAYSIQTKESSKAMLKMKKIYYSKKVSNHLLSFDSLSGRTQGSRRFTFRKNSR